MIPVPEAPIDDWRALLTFVVARGKAAGQLAAGDRIVLLGGTELPGTHHNAVMVHEVV